MLPTPVLSVSGKGFARLRISAWHFSPAPPILYAVRAIVYHKSRVLSRVLRDFSGGKAPGTPGAEPARHWLSLPRWCSQGAEPARHWFALPLWHPAGDCLACRLLPPAFTFFSAPYPPAPFPGGEGGDLRLFYARGSAPCIPGGLTPAALARPANPAPGGGVPSESPTRRKTDRTAFLLAVPAAKERGDRGRGTSAFEMVLSPGAGKTSAAWVQLPPSPCGHHSGKDSQRRPGRRGHPPSPL